jgi:hypothetical protein
MSRQMWRRHAGFWEVEGSWRMGAERGALQSLGPAPQPATVKRMKFPAAATAGMAWPGRAHGGCFLNQGTSSYLHCSWILCCARCHHAEAPPASLTSLQRAAAGNDVAHGMPHLTTFILVRGEGFPT